MKILFTGRGTSGSWQIRGVQLAAAMEATAKPMAPQGDADIAVVVKRVPSQLLPHLRRWVWDIVDAFPQPVSYSWTRATAIEWARAEIRRLNPHAIIWPTERMRDDCDDGRPGIVLRHHHRPGLVCSDGWKCGYEGGEQYLGRWRVALEVACSLQEDMPFVVNPANYSELAVVAAVRDGGGYVCSHWKSGVKHSNAVAIGARFIGNKECGYLEQAVGGEQWVTNHGDLMRAFRDAQPLNAHPYSVDQAASDLKGFLHAL